jgi:hypothetical protein
MASLCESAHVTLPILLCFVMRKPELSCWHIRRRQHDIGAMECIHRCHGVQVLSQLKAGKVRGKFCLSGGQTVVGDVRYDGEAAAATIVHMEASFSQTPTHTLFMYLHNTTIWSSVRDFDGARTAIRLAQNAAANHPLAIDIKDDGASGQSGSVACGAYAMAPSGNPAIKTPTQSSSARSSTTAFLLAAVALTLLLAVGAPAM